MALELREITATIENPAYNRSVKYDDRSIKEIEVGTRFFLRRTLEGNRKDFEILSARFVKNTTRCDTRSLVLAMVENSKIVEPANWREFIGLRDEGDHASKKTLELLFQNSETRPVLLSAFTEATK